MWLEQMGPISSLGGVQWEKMVAVVGLWSWEVERHGGCDFPLQGSCVHVLGWMVVGKGFAVENPPPTPAELIFPRQGCAFYPELDKSHGKVQLNLVT